jgi:hypothetical protein
MRMALELVVITIVLLVVAVVILMFFTNGMRAGNDMTDARNQCITMASASCKSIKSMPPTWTVPTVTYNGNLETCQAITKIQNDCSAFGVTGGTPTGGTTAITTVLQCTTTGYTCEASCTTPKTPKGACDADPAKRVCCG